ncbi:MAG TPA: TIGR03086 family metal-binding protein [Kineosporiaceae bacterium]|nr:TIGR03086 family metal-binding protein [Kineosporiaceae bacterium]
METILDLRPLHLRALGTAGTVLARVAPVDLERATPCVGWNLLTLIAHMIGQNHGFASAVELGDAPVSAYAGRPPEPGRIGAVWGESADRLAAAFAAADLDRPVRLVEISRDLMFSVATVVGFQLLDTVVHAWDVATALGERFRPDDELVATTLAQARSVPGGPARTRDGAAFAPAVPASGNDDWSELLALLGRHASL